MIKSKNILSNRIICFLIGHKKIYINTCFDILNMTVEVETCERCKSYTYMTRIIQNN